MNTVRVTPVDDLRVHGSYPLEYPWIFENRKIFATLVELPAHEAYVQYLASCETCKTEAADFHAFIVAFPNKGFRITKSRDGVVYGIYKHDKYWFLIHGRESAFELRFREFRKSVDRPSGYIKYRQT